MGDDHRPSAEGDDGGGDTHQHHHQMQMPSNAAAAPVKLSTAAAAAVVGGRPVSISAVNISIGAPEPAAATHHPVPRHRPSRSALAPQKTSAAPVVDTSTFKEPDSAEPATVEPKPQDMTVASPPPMEVVAPVSAPAPANSVSPHQTAAAPAVVSNVDDRRQRMSNLQSGLAPLCSQVLETQPRRPIASICVNEGKLYAGARDGSITEWDVSTGLVSRTFPHGHSKCVTSLCASGLRLFSASEDGSVIVWSVPTATPTRTIRGHDGFVTAVCVSPEGRLYSGGADHMINEWDANTGRRQWILTGHTLWVRALCAAQGRLYSGGNDHTVRVWDMTTGRCLLVLEEHTGWVFSLCLGRDLLYSSSRDGSVKVWDTATGQCLRTLRGHGSSDSSGVRAVCIAAGRLYSAGDDKAIVEWDVKSGKPVRTLGGHFGAVACLCAGYDGKLYSGSGDCTVRVWEIAPVPQPLTSPPTPPISPPPTSGTTTANPNHSPTPLPDPKTPDRRQTISDANNNTFQTPSSFNHSQPSSPHSAIMETYRRHTMSDRDRPLNLRSIIDTNLAADPTLDQMSPNSSPTLHAPPTTLLSSTDVNEQLSKAQELLAKQNQMRFRLKGELSSARTELAAVKSELATVRESSTRLMELEEELNAAKELLVLYKTELTVSQEAHVIALDYIVKQADSSFLEIELEMASVRHLLESPWTPLAGNDDGLEGFMPPVKVRRRWEDDSEWDSDFEAPDNLAWWRSPDPFGHGGEVIREGVRRKIGDSPDDYDETDEFGGGSHFKSSIEVTKSFIGVDADAEVAKGRSRRVSRSSLSPSWTNSDVDRPGETPLNVDEEEMTGQASLNGQSYLSQPGVAQWHRSAPFNDSSASRSSPQFYAASDEEADVEENDSVDDALWNGPVKSTSVSLANSHWHGPTSDPSAEASSALWRGPVKKSSNGNLPDDGETGGKIRSSRKMSQRRSQALFDSNFKSDDAESVVWNGPVTSGGSVVGGSSLVDAESVVWNGRVKTSRDRDTPSSGSKRQSAGYGPPYATVLGDSSSTSSASGAKGGNSSNVGAGRRRHTNNFDSPHGTVNTASAKRSSKRVSMVHNLEKLDTSTLDYPDAEQRQSPTTFIDPLQDPNLEPYAIQGLNTSSTSQRRPRAQTDVQMSPVSQGQLSTKGDRINARPVSTVPGGVGVGLSRSATATRGTPGVLSGRTASSGTSGAGASWFKPLRTWVESLSEQLSAPASPEQQTAFSDSYNHFSVAGGLVAVSPPDQAGPSTSLVQPSMHDAPSSREETDRDRARREVRERDEAARVAAAAAMGFDPLSSAVAEIAAASEGADMISPQSILMPPPRLPPRPSEIDDDAAAPLPLSLHTSSSSASVTQQSSSKKSASRSARPGTPLTSGNAVTAINTSSHMPSSSGDGALSSSTSDPASALDRIASSFENVLENVMESPWSLVSSWMRGGGAKAESSAPGQPGTPPPFADAGAFRKSRRGSANAAAAVSGRKA